MITHAFLSPQHPALTIGYIASCRTPKVVVEDINVALKAGELVCLIGPNGAGKSTLMQTLAVSNPLI